MALYCTRSEVLVEDQFVCEYTRVPGDQTQRKLGTALSYLLFMRKLGIDIYVYKIAYLQNKSFILKYVNTCDGVYNIYYLLVLVLRHTHIYTPSFENIF